MRRDKEAVMGRLVFCFAAALYFFIPPAALAFENEALAPAAFVEGTRDYTIPYLERTLNKLRTHFSEDEVWLFQFAIGEVKRLNAGLIERIAPLKANKNFLKEKDAGLVLYRETLTETTDIMFDLLRKLNERSTLPNP